MNNKDNSLFLRAVNRKPISRTPIWLMRQAGRYLKEYQKIRDKYSFLTVCKTPELATEVTLQPIKRFDFDAAILFSDILVIPEAMGMKLEFTENNGPLLSPPVRSQKDVDILLTDELEYKLRYVEEAVKSILDALSDSVPLIGFSGSPFTLAAYMIEGKPTRNFNFIKTMLYQQPKTLLNLLSKLTDAVTRYLQMQIEAGVHALQIFDTWGGILPPHLYKEYSGNFLSTIVKRLKPNNIPITLFCIGGSTVLKQLISSETAMLGVDWKTDMSEAIAIAGDKFALQGNLDPTVLFGDKSQIKNEVEHILNSFNGKPGHVFNLGHGILPDTPEDNVSYLVDCVREKSSRILNQN